jgi:dihydroneopterin aldolase
MGMIYLKNIKVYAYHGCLAEETLIGSDYLVQLKVWADLKKSTTSDQLEDTVDYVLLNAIVKKEMGSDPSAVAFEAVQQAIAKDVDILIIIQIYIILILSGI